MTGCFDQSYLDEARTQTCVTSVSVSVTETPVDILLVEDNPGDVRLIEEAFRDTSLETQFQTATDGTDALDILRERQESDSETYPDLLLLDLNLPRMDGFAVLEAIKDDPAYPPLPVLVLTSSEAEDDVVRSYELSANAYLTKPDGPEDFTSLGQAIERFWFEMAHLPPATS